MMKAKVINNTPDFIVRTVKIANEIGSFAKSIRDLQSAIKTLAKEVSDTWKEYHVTIEKIKSFSSEHLKYQNLSSVEILEILKDDEWLDSDIKKMLKSIFSKKQYIEFLTKSLKSINRVLKHLIKILCSNFNRNKRFFYRKIQNFIFKNLDDYHSAISFN